MEKSKKAGDFRMVATTFFGLESVLAAELLKLGARDIQTLNRAVSFTGDEGFLYKANLCLRTALRVLRPIHTFIVRNEEHLYDEIKKMRWEEYISPKDTFGIDAVLNSSLFTHSLYVAQRVKDAIVDRFQARMGKRPSVDLADPTIRINVHIGKDNVTVSLDSTGESLHKRGYRKERNIAPLNEVLAAGLVAITGWDPHFALIDPMCGSGTIAIEAALQAANIPPGYFRLEGVEKQIKGFAFMNWRSFDADLWETILKGVTGRIKNGDFPIYASDLSPNVVKKAKENLKTAMVEDMVKIQTANFIDLAKPASKGIVIVNPPYGERMNKDELTILYKSLGDTFKKNWAGYDCWIISSNMEALASIGLHPTRKVKLYNGKLECSFRKFTIYEGSKRSNE